MMVQERITETANDVDAAANQADDAVENAADRLGKQCNGTNTEALPANGRKTPVTSAAG
jgi:hypothetical protein